MVDNQKAWTDWVGSKVIDPIQQSVLWEDTGSHRRDAGARSVAELLGREGRSGWQKSTSSERSLREVKVNVGMPTVSFPSWRQLFLRGILRCWSSKNGTDLCMLGLPELRLRHTGNQSWSCHRGWFGNQQIKETFADTIFTSANRVGITPVFSNRQHWDDFETMSILDRNTVSIFSPMPVLLVKSRWDWQQITKSVVFSMLLDENLWRSNDLCHVGIAPKSVTCKHCFGFSGEWDGIHFMVRKDETETSADQNTWWDSRMGSSRRRILSKNPGLPNV